MFGRSVTNTNVEMIVDLINKATGAEFESNFFFKLGQETLRLEAQFNKEAGFQVEDDDLPQFFYDEPLAPSEQVARFKAQEVNDAASKWWKSQGYTLFKISPASSIFSFSCLCSGICFSLFLK